MDINNKYLLSPSNSMIYVSDKQIEAMESTNVIKVEKWTPVWFIHGFSIVAIFSFQLFSKIKFIKIHS